MLAFKTSGHILAHRSVFLVLTLSLVVILGLGQQRASASTIPLVTLTNGNEVIEDFSSQTSEYEFVVYVTNPVFAFDMAFGGTDQYEVQFQPGPNTGRGTFPSTLSEQGPISTSITAALTFNTGYSSGSLDIFVTDESVGADPFAGFEISNSGINLDIPSATPIPGAFALFAAGLGALGLLGVRRNRNARAVAI